MKRLLTAFLIALIPSLVLAQGSGTPANLRVLTDANGYLAVVGGAQTAPTTTSTFSNTRLQTDANGYLYVVITGGTVTGPILLPDGSVTAPSLAFTGDTGNNSGLYLVGQNEVGITTNGVLSINFATSSIISYHPIYLSGAGSHLEAGAVNASNIGSATTPFFAGFFGAQSIGTTTTAGLTLQNLTAAAAGAQQYSPGLSFIGHGWKTDATAASQPVEARWELRPVQGAASPSYNYILMGRVNVGSWSDHLTITSQGNLTPGSNVVLGDTRGLYWFSRGSWSSSADGAYTLNNNGFTANLAVGLSATGGAKLASHAISLAQDATTKVGTAPVGILTVTNTTDSNVCTFSLIGTGVVAEITDATGGCSATKDNAATVNVYYDTDGVYVQNKITATKSVRLMLNGV